jgi:hypothetical protein
MIWRISELKCWLVVLSAAMVSIVASNTAAQSSWYEPTAEYRETATAVFDETLIWNWVTDPQYNRHFEEVAVSPNGQKLGFVVKLDNYWDKHIYVANTDGTGLIDITSTLPAATVAEQAKNVMKLRWNDDGTRLFFYANYFTDLYYYDTGTGTTNPAVLGMASVDSRIPYSINSTGTQVYFKHNAGYSQALQKNLQGIFTAPVGGTPGQLMDIDQLPHQLFDLNLLRYLGTSRQGGNSYFTWNQDYYGGHAVAQWRLSPVAGPLVMDTTKDYVWTDQNIRNTIISADGSRVLYEYIDHYGDKTQIRFIDVPGGVITPITETADGNGFSFQTISPSGTLVRLNTTNYRHTIVDLATQKMRDTHSYFFQMSISDLTDITADDRYYYMSTYKYGVAAADRLYQVDMKPVAFSKAPEFTRVAFSAPALYHGENSTIKVKATVSDAQGLGTITWVRLFPLIAGRENPDWSMGRQPLAFPTGDSGSTFLYDDGTNGDETPGDGVFTFNSIATRKGDYTGWNTWFTHVTLPDSLDIRLMALDTEGNYTFYDTSLLITETVPAAPDAGFAILPLNQGLPRTYRFTDTSLGNVSSWSWNFGDGSTGTGATPQHIYQQAGLYPVTLTVTGPGGTDSLRVESAVDTRTAVEDDTPVSFLLSPPYPNPFNSQVSLRFTLLCEGQAALTVYDVCGRKVAQVSNGYFFPGEHQVVWDSRDSYGNEVSSGLYLFRLEAGGKSAFGKAMLMK